MFAIELARINGRNSDPVHTPIPADSTPEAEMAAFFSVMDAIGAPHCPFYDGDGYAVRLEGTDERGYLWRVRVVDIEPPVDYEDTREMVPGTNDFGTEVYSK